jgi:hypothetical protein
VVSQGAGEAGVVDAYASAQRAGDRPLGVIGPGYPVRGVGEVPAASDSAVKEPMRDVASALR